MGIYNFGNDGDTTITGFHATHESFRSDVEQENTPVAIHNDESADIKMARLQAEEMINVSGANIKVYLRTDNADYDAVFDEDADPTYWPPVPMKAFFKPEPLQAELMQWGIDTPNKTEVVFSFRQLFEKFGKRMLRPGDVFQLPYNSTIGLKNFRVLNATPTGNYKYIWLYLTCQVETLTADVTVRPEEDMPDDGHINTGGVYREII